jgi:hypothetical protein
VVAIIALGATAAGCEETTLGALVARLAPELPFRELAVFAAEAPADGEALYELGDRIEVAMIRSRRRAI